VAVIGCGGVGLNVIQGCRLAGASQIIAVDVFDEKLAMAKSLGATHTVNAKETDPVKAVKELTGGLGAEFAFEAIGVPECATQGFSMLRPGGTCVVVGMRPHGLGAISVPGPDFLREKKLIGLYVWQRPIPRSYAQAGGPVSAGPPGTQQPGEQEAAPRRGESRL